MSARAAATANVVNASGGVLGRKVDLRTPGNVLPEATSAEAGRSGEWRPWADLMRRVFAIDVLA